MLSQSGALKNLATLLFLAPLLASCGGERSDSTADPSSSTPAAQSNSAQIQAAALAATLRSGPTNLCLGVANGSTQVRTPTQIQTCDSSPGQQWEFTAARELRTFGGSRCLDVRGASTQPQAIVQSYSCNGGANQQWSFKPDGTVVSVQSGLCLTVLGGGTAPGTGTDTWPCSSGIAHQKWSLQGVNTDTQAPAPPSGLKASGLSCNAVTLSWAASSDNVGIAFYDIYNNGQLLKTVGGSTLSTTLGLREGSQVGLYVNARDAAGNVSQASLTLPVSVPPCVLDNQAPTVPTGLRGVATGTTVALSWTASTDNLAVAAYDIYRNNNKVGSTANLLFTDSGLAANTTYRYAVAARDAQNNVSALSTITSVTTGSSCTSAVCLMVEVARDTDLPWGIASLTDGSILYSRRDAKDIVRLNPTNGSKTIVGTVPNVDLTDGEGGLLGLAVSPNFPGTDQWLYIYHTSASDNRIVRIRYVNGSLDTNSLQVLIKGIGRNKFHNGGRLRYGPDGKLYATTGDAQNAQFAQDLNNLAGKVLRLNPDGSVPSDNPFANSYVWSYGHRNPQGLAFDSRGRLWAQEFGNSAQDETNMIKKGGNHGWPTCEGTVSQGGEGCATAGFVAPKYTYPTAEASCSGIAIVRDVLYVACLRGKRVYRHVISGDSLTNTQQLFSDTYGRLRTVEPTLDGGLWMSTSNTGDKDSIASNSDERIFKINLGN
ncbi:PQQ-dependent sugar dehydrogenase [Deinococcus sp. QL22]|uniref:PQQ-dependent sugar dehydrogenase n=1 Tax=Deinococcus sp. QL22 TaxID=2939437 RepID=UPI002017F636|nr:PQQ-dependent sugar dehydrogenase [Deinococcus sp. QL22]UQN09773.1 PQQ-dependent sugar dehydrogenase [Deinococcus sp. QL22]